MNISLISTLLVVIPTMITPNVQAIMESDGDERGGKIGNTRPHKKEVSAANFSFPADNYQNEKFII